MHAIPGDPFTSENGLSQEVLETLMRHHGLDKPWYVQYGHYLKGIFTGDLGPSLRYEGRSVSSIIAEGFPISLLLGMEALIIAVAAGVSLGILAAYSQRKWQNSTFMVFATLGIAVPSFLLATLLQYLFAMKLSWLPVARWGSFAQTILPALALAGSPTAFIARLTRAGLLEAMKQDYALTARAKGMGETALFVRHLLRNAILPVITYLGPLSASIITGSFIVEKIFGIPGLGSWLIGSILNRDYTAITGIALFYSALLMIAILAVDLFYRIIDPRISLAERRK